MEREILEINEDDFDSILAGCMKVLKKLDELFKEEMMRDNSPVFNEKFIIYLINDCLFKRDKIDSLKSYPLCKNEKTRI